MQFRSSLACFGILLASACSTPLVHPQSEVRASPSPCPATDAGRRMLCFGEPEDAPAGKARLYVFRPDFSEREDGDVPVLAVGDTIEVDLRRLSYAALDLELGRHAFSLAPGEGDSPIWNLSGVLELTAPGRYYLAIWNSDTAHEKDSAGKALRESLSGAAASAAMGAAMTIATGGIAVYPVLVPRAPGWTATASEARFELVEEAEALGVIRQCTVSHPHPRREQ